MASGSTDRRCSFNRILLVTVFCSSSVINTTFAAGGGSRISSSRSGAGGGTAGVGAVRGGGGGGVVHRKQQQELDCEICPNGFFDGCNNCGCGDDGITFCTLRACIPEQLDEPSCNDNEQPPIMEEPVVSCETCSSGQYNDGCNTCFCSEEPDGPVACTEKACFVQGTPFCIEEDDKKDEINCINCPGGFYDGCNVCGCDGDTVSLCTLRYCEPEEFEEPTCNTIVEEVVDCSTCSSGLYFDGCNDCSCIIGDDGITLFPACTKRACPSEALEEPYCKEEPEPICDDDITIELWNTDNDMKIGNLGKKINLCRYRDVGLTLVANTSPCVEKIVLKVRDRETKDVLVKSIDKNIPYSLGGDDGRGDLFPSNLLKQTGNYTVIVRPIQPARLIDTGGGSRQKMKFSIEDDKCS